MATAPLTSALNPPQDPALQDLLASLDPNILPIEPSWWPLPLGYWLVMFSVVLIGLAVWFGLHKTKTVRQLNAEITRLEQYPPEQQALAAHQLLRWVCIHLADQPQRLNEQQFADYIAQRCGTVPAWLNSHYSNQPPLPIDWTQYRWVVKQLCRRGAA